MRIAIFDHSADDRHVLARLLGEAFMRRSIHLTVEQYDDVWELLCDMEEGGVADAVILDLSVDPEEAVEVAARLRRLPFGGELIFTSPTADFAVDGYDLGVGGYLLKPYREERLLRLAERLSRSEHPACLMVCHYRTLIRVPYHEIAYLESNNTKCLIHLRDGGEYRVYRQLDELEREMSDPRFLRCHQSFLVNMDTIVRADTSFELENGETVAIRQRELRRMRAAYLAYIQRGDKQSDEDLFCK